MQISEQTIGVLEIIGSCLDVQLFCINMRSLSFFPFFWHARSIFKRNFLSNGEATFQKQFINQVLFRMGE